CSKYCLTFPSDQFAPKVVRQIRLPCHSKHWREVVPILMVDPWTIVDLAREIQGNRIVERHSSEGTGFSFFKVTTQTNCRLSLEAIDLVHRGCGHPANAVGESEVRPHSPLILPVHFIFLGRKGAISRGTSRK